MTLLHEVQHAIQEKEGFAIGGSPSQYLTGYESEKTKEFREKVQSLSSFLYLHKDLSSLKSNKYKSQLNRYLKQNYPKEISMFGSIKEFLLDKPFSLTLSEYQNKLWEQVQEKQELDKLDKYEKIAGEVEARNVSHRSGLTPDQRRKFLIQETEYVAEKDKEYIYYNFNKPMNVKFSMENFIEENKTEIFSQLKEKGIIKTKGEC
jgi:hypothetical protein